MGFPPILKYSQVYSRPTNDVLQTHVDHSGTERGSCPYSCVGATKGSLWSVNISSLSHGKKNGGDDRSGGANGTSWGLTIGPGDSTEIGLG